MAVLNDEQTMLRDMAREWSDNESPVGAFRRMRDAAPIEPCGERIEDTVPPGHEVEIVAEPAQERLERVAVGVDRAGKESLTGQPYVEGARRADVVDGGDMAAGDPDRAVRFPAGIRQDEIGEQPRRLGHAAHPVAGPGSLTSSLAKASASCA